MLLNFPNNPTGYTPTEAEAKALTAEIRKAAEAGNRIVVVLDDAYFGLVYEEGMAQRISVWLAGRSASQRSGREARRLHQRKIMYGVSAWVS